MTKAARPCPFCEGPANRRGYPDYGYDVWCPNCQTELMHIDDWNQRPAEDRLRATLGDILRKAAPYFAEQGWYITTMLLNHGLTLEELGIDPKFLTKPESG